ncbi:MAG: AzlC family ABC transporter permease [Motiliproteus sp.]
MHSETVNAVALRASLPVLFGYLPLGMAFGVLFSDLGYHWIFATLMGLFVYAGAGQFLAVGLLANHAALMEIAVTTFLLNSRHLFYGISLVGRLRNRSWRRIYQIFGLTDETYSLLTSTRLPEGLDEAAFQFRVTLFNQLYWVLGCTLGAWLGGQISFSTAGIEFVLPALFMVLVIEQYRHIRHPAPFVLAVVMGMLTLLLISRDQMLLISIALSLSALLLYKGGQRWNPYHTS